MATVPITESQEERPKIDPSFVMMAAAEMNFHRAPSYEESAFKDSMKKIKENLAAEEDPNINKYPARTVVPGEEAIDRELGPQSPRKINRI